MATRKQSKAKCTYCGLETTKAPMTKHLTTKCPKHLEAIAHAELSTAKSELLFYLRVQDASSKDFWLDLEMRGSASLQQLDRYLRAIWLECCGHMSEFCIGRWGTKVAMSRKAQDVFLTISELIHLYDFGTTSETIIKVLAERNGKPTTKHPIVLMARNLPPEAKCIECGEPATWLCQECLVEDDIWGVLCDKHVKEHPHDNYGEPVPLINSPRLGMCGYEGPANPPY